MQKNTIEPTPTNTILGIMINPSYEALALIAQLISMFCLNAEFLLEVEKPMISSMNSASGGVFRVINNNLSVNHKTGAS